MNTLWHGQKNDIYDRYDNNK